MKEWNALTKWEQKIGAQDPTRNLFYFLDIFKDLQNTSGWPPHCFPSVLIFVLASQLPWNNEFSHETKQIMYFQME